MQNVMSIDRIYEEGRFFSIIRNLKSFSTEQVMHQKDNYFLWIPVLFALGIGLYFYLPFEPPSSLVFFVFLISLALYFIVTGNRIYSVSALLLLVIISGVGAAKLRTETVGTKIINKKISFANVIGTISYIEPMDLGSGSRIILSDLNIDGLKKIDTPKKIRLKIRKDSNIEIGQVIKILASLNPPSEPIIPDGFNFRRYLYFQGIGAVGFVYNEPEILSSPIKGFLNIQRLRYHISTKLYDYLSPQSASIAAALLVGYKNAISDSDKQAVRDSGLAHMLAISGLHVGLFAGTLFFLIRFLLAFFPNIALYYPVKKIAAIIALLGAVFYMLLAGSTVPTQRAVFMVGIVFLAIILDRSPISLRLVAASALIILLFRPESLLSASFQMSFAAVTCLIYFYDITRPIWTKFYTKGNLIKRAASYFIAVTITTVIASIATSPFALYHFGQVSFVGSIANLVAVPLLTFVIMPFALLSIIFMPLGLSYFPITIMGWGIEKMLEIAYWAASLPHAILLVPLWSFISFITIILSIIFMILWKGYGKVIAIPFFLWALLISQINIMPDILVSASHKLLLFRTDNKKIYVSSRKNDRFVLKNWEKFYGIPERSAFVFSYKGEYLKSSNNNAMLDKVSCGEDGCRLIINGYKVSFVRNSYILAQECIWADILISIDPISNKSCDVKYMIDQFDTWKYGAHAIWLKPDKVLIKKVSQSSANRPWSKYKDFIDNDPNLVVSSN